MFRCVTAGSYFRDIRLAAAMSVFQHIFAIRVLSRLSTEPIISLRLLNYCTQYGPQIQFHSKLTVPHKHMPHFQAPAVQFDL